MGNGPKGFRQYCRKVNYDPPIGICSTHPHNYFFQILSELGLLGVFILPIWNIFYCIKTNKLLQYNRDQNIMTSSFYITSLGLLVLLFPFVPSGNFFNNWISIISYFYIGIYIYLYEQMQIKK